MNQHKHVYLSQDKLVARGKRCIKFMLKPNTPDKTPLPSTYSLRGECPEPYDQGQVGSCTANATCMAYRLQEKDKSFLPSRLYFYYYERLVEDTDKTPLTDSGGDVADGLSYAKVNGICSEGLWPYDETKVEVKPADTCDQDAKNHKILDYTKIALTSALEQGIKRYLFKGFPVLAAIAVYDSFESDDVAATGTVPLPDTSTEQALGGHEVLIVGYDDSTQRYTCINSWGSEWGDKGFFTLPYAYVADSNLGFEYVVIRV